jgi:hypothetical protein
MAQLLKVAGSRAILRLTTQPHKPFLTGASGAWHAAGDAA